MTDGLKQVPTLKDLEKSLSEYIEARGEARLERAHRFSLTESEIEQLGIDFLKEPDSVAKALAGVKDWLPQALERVKEKLSFPIVDKPIIVYTKACCQQCKATVRMLEKKKVSYQVIDVDSLSKEAVSRLKTVYSSAPVVEVFAGGFKSSWAGFNPQMLKNAIDRVKHISPAALKINQWKTNHEGQVIDWNVITQVLHIDGLKNLDLSGADLSGADFSGEALENVNLHGANLYYVNLEGCVINDSNLSGADLRGARLDRACVEYTSLRGSDCTGMRGADVMFNDCDLQDVRITESNMPNVQMVNTSLKQADFTATTLTSGQFNNVDAKDAVFEDVQASYLTVEHSDFAHADFSGALLDKAYVGASSCREVDFSTGSLKGTRFESSDLSKATFDDCTLKGARADNRDLSEVAKPDNSRSEALKI